MSRLETQDLKPLLTATDRMMKQNCYTVQHQHWALELQLHTTIKHSVTQCRQLSCLTTHEHTTDQAPISTIKSKE